MFNDLSTNENIETIIATNVQATNFTFTVPDTLVAGTYLIYARIDNIGTAGVY